jgi:hypothetical protein
MVSFLKEDFDYASHYCEENIYQLINKLESSPVMFAVFVSTITKQTPIWCQRLSEDPSKPVVWDYHVFFVKKAKDGENSIIVDFDTTLPFFCPADVYVRESFRLDWNLPPEYSQVRYDTVPSRLLNHISKPALFDFYCFKLSAISCSGERRVFIKLCI